MLSTARTSTTQSSTRARHSRSTTSRGGRRNGQRERDHESERPQLHAVDEGEHEAPETENPETELAEGVAIPEVVSMAAGPEIDEDAADASEAAAGPVIDIGATGTPADAGLTDYSTIGAYLHELRRYPLMTREE